MSIGVKRKQKNSAVMVVIALKPGMLFPSSAGVLDMLHGDGCF